MKSLLGATLYACCFPSLLLISPSLHAQIDRAEINGTITDRTGAVVSGASVSLARADTGSTQTVASNDSGIFVLSALPIGRYTMTVTRSGFSPAHIEGIELNSGVTRTINAHLEVESATQTATVTAEVGGDILDKNDATLGGTVQSEQISRIPLNGRNIATLELLAPGVIDTGTGQQGTIHIAGQGIDDNNYRFDGVDAAGGIRQALKSGLRLQFSTEAVAEFKVDAGAYTADTGGSSGGQVSLISKSGTNAFHGAFFDYLRNKYFDAQPLFSGANSPNFHLNQFGTNLGGPILRDRTFFFANYEAFRQTLGGIPALGIVPSAAYRAQILAAQPSLAPFINAYPTSSTVSATDPNQALYTSIVPSPNQENSGVIRIDHRLGARDSTYARYSIDDGLATSSLNNAGQALTVGSRVQNFVLEELHTFSSTLLNEAEYGFNRNTYIQNQNTGLPYNFSIAGFTSIAETYNKTQVPTTFSVNDTLTVIRGRHTIKAGIDVRRIYQNEANSTDGTLSFTAQTGLSAEQAVLANHLNSIQVTAPLNDRGLRKTQYAVYTQDQWKAAPNLTLNYGLRYNYFSPFVEGHNNEDPFDFASCGGYCGVGAEFYFRNFLSFDPRVSVAYSPESLHGNTVFRAGFGIYHGEIQLGDEDSPVVNTEPSTTLTSSATRFFSYPSALASIPATGLATTPRSLARHHPDSYTTQYTASIQQALGNQTAFTATYLGIKGTHLFRRTQTNLIDPSTGVRPYAALYPSQIDTKQMEGMSIFHALQLNLNRRFHNGILLSGNYMFSHALDDDTVGSGEAASAENVNNFRADYANSTFDVRHSANGSIVYDLPFGPGRRFLRSANLLVSELAGGWSVDSLLAVRSGLPVDITISRSSTALPDGNNINQRPDRVPGVSLYNGKGIKTWLNPAAFAVPLPGTWGNLGRNAAVGPTLWQDDSAVEKHFRIKERKEVIFRAEAFNLFNRAQYGQPNASLSTGTIPLGSPIGTRPTLSVPSTFGQITSPINTAGLVGTGTQRVLEFALRLTY